MNTGAQATPGWQETALLDHVQRLGRSANGRRAIHLKLSTLRPQNRQPQRLQIAALAFDSLISTCEGQLFRLQNDDFVVLCKDAGPNAISEAIGSLANLFAGDPAIMDVDAAESRFCQQYDLAKSYTRFVAVARELLEDARNNTTAQEAARAVRPEATVHRMLDPKTLGGLQTAIAQADLTNVIRRQPVCAVVPGQPPKPVFTEVFTSMAALCEVLTPDVDIFANRWLFQDLIAHLDRRVISFLGHKDDSTLTKAFSINLNVSSLTSPEFLAFDRNLSNDARETVVIELQLIDVLADIDSFLFSRNFLRDRNYRFCLDGLTHQTLPLVDCKRLGVDLVKIIWHPELHDLAKAKDAAFMDAVKTINPSRIILIRCDDEKALQSGKLLGSSLYQGFLIDKLLKQRAGKPLAAAASA